MPHIGNSLGSFNQNVKMLFELKMLYHGSYRVKMCRKKNKWMVNNNAKPNACSVSLKIDTKILYLYRKWWWSGGGRRRKMQDNCIFLPRVKSRRCANILRASGYLEYSRIWLLFSPDNTTSQQSSLRPGNGGYISNQALVKCCIHGEKREGNQQLEPPPCLGE